MEDPSADAAQTAVIWQDWVFAVDVEKTRAYYRSHSLCECAYCRNFYEQIPGKYPELEEFLRKFGVDAAAPDEILSVEPAPGSVEYLNVNYTVCGRIPVIDAREELPAPIRRRNGKRETPPISARPPQKQWRLGEDSPLRVAFSGGFVCPNEQTGAYFTISVTGIHLPMART